MAIRIFNNISSLTTSRALDNNNTRLKDSVIRIASGIRVNKASDDTGSFTISEFLRADTRILKQATKNASTAISMISSAEAALNETASILIRMRELAAQASTGTIGNNERESLQLELGQLTNEIDRIADVSEFNGNKLIDGSLARGSGSPTVIAIGVDSASSNLMDLNDHINLTAATTGKLGIDSVSLNTRSGALLALRDIGNAIDSLTEVRGRIGLTLKRLSRVVSSLNTNVQNLTAADSTIRDANLSEEFAELTRSQILVQSSAAMVGQSNLISKSVLKLLK
tara:strand:+ start:28 stop:879 length:852 start_codon:yes stop_codon:yes gene_type:complete